MTTAQSRLRLAVLYGGRSAEHDVSLASAKNVMKCLDPETYEAVPIFISKEGIWRLGAYQDGNLSTPQDGPQISFLPGRGGAFVVIEESGAKSEIFQVSAVFPVLHGLPGEDGTIQGLASVAGVPLVGCGLAGSAAAIDKDVAKRLFLEAGLPVARSMIIREGEEPSFDILAEALRIPIFIKPARQGSSVGVSKVSRKEEYKAALASGFEHDNKLLAEEFITAREIEFGVLEDENGKLLVSCPGEIVPSEVHGFYSYDAKYIDADGALLKIPAELPDDKIREMQRLAIAAFRTLGCNGIARVDFFVSPDGRLLINEVNTIPGFTDISMYSKVMEASGIPFSEVIDRLVALALKRSR